MPDWKKEIKLSDLFKRPAKGTATPAAPPLGEPADEKPKAQGGSILKKEIKLFKRAPKAPKEPKEPKAAKEPKVEDGSVLKKEIRLFKRTPKAPKEPKAAKEPKAEGGSVPKKEIKLSFKRRPKEPKAAKEPKPDRAANPKREKKAAPMPAIPLMRAFNLLPRDDAREKQRRPAGAQLVMAAVTLILVAGLGSVYTISSARVADKQTTRDELRSRLQTLLAQQQPAEDPQADQGLLKEQQDRTVALSTALGTRVAWDRLLRDVSLVLPEDVWLQSVIATPPVVVDPTISASTPGGSGLTINGFTRAQDGVAHFLSRLGVLAQLSSVGLLSSAVVTVGGEDVVQFAITATVKPPAGAAA